MKADELARIWPERWPRPGEETNQNHRRAVRKFARDFEGREITLILKAEAREWALANLGTARYVRAMFNDAEVDGLLEGRGNVFAELRLPIPGDAPVNVPPREKVNDLIGQAYADKNYDLASAIGFAAFVGLRSGEQRAVLLPGDAGMGNPFVDTIGQRLLRRASHRRLAIDWQLGRDGKLRRPKTKRSLRRVLVPEPARAAVELAITHHRLRHDSSFLWPTGRRRRNEEWSELRREVGFWCKWHDLRHHAATWLLDQGATVEDVAVQLGTHPGEVRDRYGHPDDEKALARLEQLTDG